jgi:hypothetical protein
MVGHAPVINKRKSVNHNKEHRRKKASARKVSVHNTGVVVPRRSSKKMQQVEKRLRHQLADAKAAALAAGFVEAVAAEMQIDEGLAAAKGGKKGKKGAAARTAGGDVEMTGGK